MRTKPTTSWTGRTWVNTNWSKRTKLDYLIQETLWKLLLESWEGALLLNRSINIPIWDRPRYSNYVEDIDTINLLDLDWVEALTISWTEINKIDTFWT